MNVSGKCRSPPAGGANSALSNPLAGFEGPIRGRGNKKGKARMRKGKEGNRKWKEWAGENTPNKLRTYGLYCSLIRCCSHAQVAILSP